MRIVVHIGLESCGVNRLQNVLSDKRNQLSAKGVRYASAPGNRNHTRLWMAMTDPDHVDPLRYNRGFISAAKQNALRDMLHRELAAEIGAHTPDVLILSATQLCWLYRACELERLHDFLGAFSNDIRIVAHVGNQAEVLSRTYAAQVLEGRGTPLSRELEVARGGNWWERVVSDLPEIDPQAGQFIETQAIPFWLDYQALVSHWEGVFGTGSVTVRSFHDDSFATEDITEEIRASFGIKAKFGEATEPPPQPEPSAVWLARARQLNALLLQVLAQKKHVLTRSVWRSFLNDIKVDGTQTQPEALHIIAPCFAAGNRALIAHHSTLSHDMFDVPATSDPWSEPHAGNGFRATQYLLAFFWRIERATQQTRKGRITDLAEIDGDPVAAPDIDGDGALSPDARAIMPPLAVQNFVKLRRSSFKPHNKLGAVNEEDLAAAYAPAPARALPNGSSGNVIVGCMKNEAPYILEWVAYHRAIGVDNFLIYTNGCEDGTSEILDRLQHMGILQHRLNDDWSGNSPQQYALNRALEEPVIQNANWIIHIDVDEFINVRCGNGTLADFFAHVPDATNVAMTWRLFGHNGVTDLSDDLVIDQFDTCAPKFCPKPHTVWGFKTMFQNIGAYAKISCHRPNKLSPGAHVKWVNGSGQDMTREVAKNGWRNSKKSIGYDLIQLNHYALRSAESFLIKRQRGRALHVDRSIGLNYWIRMDWGDYRDITIKRNIPRLRAEMDRLLQDKKLRKLHDNGLAWHRAKAAELHGMREFQDLYEQALKVKLNGTERVAYALALDMES
ncbi:MAG: glycosyltransferase family 2 protein [Pseudomonadota bacterium]